MPIIRAGAHSIAAGFVSVCGDVAVMMISNLNVKRRI
jgi:hypothetical protein